MLADKNPEDILVVLNAFKKYPIIKAHELKDVIAEIDPENKIEWHHLLTELVREEKLMAEIATGNHIISWATNNKTNIYEESLKLNIKKKKLENLRLEKELKEFDQNQWQKIINFLKKPYTIITGILAFVLLLLEITNNFEQVTKHKVDPTEDKSVSPNISGHTGVVLPKDTLKDVNTNNKKDSSGS